MRNKSWHILYEAQIPSIKKRLEDQGHCLAQALARGQPLIRFSLPERILIPGPADGQVRFLTIPHHLRKQRVGSFLKRATGEIINTELFERLARLKGSPDPAIACSAGLLCHVAALYLVEHMVPTGQAVKYIAAGGEEILSNPAGPVLLEAAAGELQASYLDCSPEARCFYLPYWVAFDRLGRLLVSSLEEAEIRIAVLQRFGCLLQAAIALAPELEFSEIYSQKRRGLLGQLVNQGRALALAWTGTIIDTICRRSAAGTLNRGLSLSVPYFDDREFAVKTREFEVIPRGRVGFMPVFVVCAVRDEEEKVAQDERLSSSTRSHLLAELRTIERAFTTSGMPPRGGVKSRNKLPAGRQAGTVPSCLGINPGGPD